MLIAKVIENAQHVWLLPVSGGIQCAPKVKVQLAEIVL